MFRSHRNTLQVFSKIPSAQKTPKKRTAGDTQPAQDVSVSDSPLNPTLCAKVKGRYVHEQAVEDTMLEPRMLRSSPEGDGAPPGVSTALARKPGGGALNFDSVSLSFMCGGNTTLNRSSFALF